jgi:hypothetical protein
MLARDAIVFHFKPPVPRANVPSMIRQARAQARTAAQFLEKHPHWRIALATGQIAPLQFWSAVARAVGWPKALELLAGDATNSVVPQAIRRWAAARLARAAYYDELAKANRGP